MTEDKLDARKSMDQMVSLFGSEKQKRAFSAAQKNKVQSDLLETALEPAFSHAQANVDKTPVSGECCGLRQKVFNLTGIALYRSLPTEFRAKATSQPSS